MCMVIPYYDQSMLRESFPGLVRTLVTQKINNRGGLVYLVKSQSNWKLPYFLGENSVLVSIGHVTLFFVRPNTPNQLSNWEINFERLNKLNTIPLAHNAPVKWVSIDSDTGFWFDRHQAIIRINAGIWLVGPLWTNFSVVRIKIQNMSCDWNAFENVVWKKAAILSRGRWVTN